MKKRMFYCVSRSGGLGAPWEGSGVSDLIASRPLREAFFSVVTVFNRLEARWGTSFLCFCCVFMVFPDLGSLRATRGALMTL